MSGTEHDVIKLARQILNRGNAHRTIPKQECMVELAELPLIICSEITETVNLSGSYKLSSSSHNDLVSKYRRIAASNPDLSLHQFFLQQMKNKQKTARRLAGKTIIPHYVGANGQPKYPPTKEYAMATLLVHKPWGSCSPPLRTDTEWIKDFNDFVKSDTCPQEVVMEYHRVKERHESKRPPEAVAAEECYDTEIQPDMDEKTKDLMSIVTNLSLTTDPFLSLNDHQFDRGFNYDWSQRTNPVSSFIESTFLAFESERGYHYLKFIQMI